MRLTYELLKAQTPPACDEQANEFQRLFPDGCEPTVENLTFLANHEHADRGLLDVTWLVRLLPKEGPGSMRAFALWCAEQVAYLCDDQRVRDCIEVVRRRVDVPGSCTDQELAAAGDAAGDALAPTIAELQASAFSLLDRMIAA